MPLPAGFKVNGSKIEKGRPIHIPPAVRKIISLLERLPFGNLLTTREISLQSGLAVNGSQMGHPGLDEYCEKVDNKKFWGNRKSIAQLRKQLAETEPHA